MRELAAAYRYDVLDIDALLQSPVFEGQVFRELYFDGSHYKPPMVTNYIASVCALHIIARRRDNKPPSDRPGSPGYALRFFDFATQFPGAGRIQEFKSQRYTAVARELDATQHLDFEVDGLPCGISFIAACDVGSVLMEVNGEPSILHMLHRENVPFGKYRFLIRHNPFYWINYASPDTDIPRKSRVRLRLIDNTDADWDDSIARDSFAMIPAPPRNPGARLCLLGLDYLSRE
jgi:hypothetical protein